MTLYLHIGTPKTGTTSIQHFLHLNRSALLERGYLYPSLGRQAEHHRWLWEQEGEAGHHGAVLRAEIADCGARHVIISAENLHVRMKDRTALAALQDFVAGLGCGAVRIIVYLRPQVQMLVSMLSQDIWAGRRGWREAAALPHPQDHPARRLLDHRHTLENWGSVFGPDSLCVRLFAPDAFCEGDLLRDFMQAVDLPGAHDLKPPPPGEARNEALNLLAMRLYGGVTDVLRAQGLPAGEARAVLGQLLPHVCRCLGPLNQDPGLKYTPPQELCEEYESYYAACNEWVRCRFFPGRSRLFAPVDYSCRPERTDLQELQPQWWQALTCLLADLARQDAAGMALIRALTQQAEQLQAQCSSSAAVPSPPSEGQPQDRR